MRFAEAHFDNHRLSGKERGTMGLGKSIEKLDEYYSRLNEGKAQKIKPSHVKKVIEKLKVKEKSLKSDLTSTENESKKQRLERKLSTVAELIQRANWLLEKIE